MIEPRNHTIFEAARALRAGTLSAQSLLESCLRRVQAREVRVQAFAHLALDAARAAAVELDHAAARGHWLGPLHGIPLGVKDVIDVREMPTTAGTEAYPRRVAAHDATAVARLRRAGAIILGKTVTTPFANRDPQPTRNPWDLTRSPGGSSSGSGAAVADRMLLGALGTQSGGSVLRPAAFCGVVGYKPSTGRTDLAGVVPNVTELDHIGVLARDLTDAQLLFEVYRDNPAGDWGERPDRLPEPLASRAPKRLWRVRDYFESNCTEEVLEGFETACKRLLEAGVELVEQPLPPAFDGVQETHAAIAQSIIARYSQPDFAAHPERFPPLLAAVIRSGLERRAVEYLDAQRRRTTLRDEMHAALAGVDGALLPACPTPPTPASDTGEAIFLAPWSLTGLPALSVPSGRFANGLPQAVQLIGAVGDDGAVLGVGRWLEERLEVLGAPD